MSILDPTMNMIRTFSLHLQTLALAYRVRKAFVRARQLGLPGQAFYRLGRSMGWTLFRHVHPAARKLLMSPVSSTRYFEFDFALRSLLRDTTVLPRRYLDVSSPYLFSFYVTRHFPDDVVRMMNPDARDLKQTRQLAEVLRWQRLEFFQKGVESLEAIGETFDAVWSISVIEHIAGANGDDRDAVRRMWRVVRPGGRLILTVPTDLQTWDEYRSDDPYGTQQKSELRSDFFFQRFYDESSIRERIISSLGCEPDKIEWFGEKKAGHFHAYIDRWKRLGLTEAIHDPLDIAENYQSYASFSDMPGAGVCGMLFIKTEEAM